MSFYLKDPRSRVDYTIDWSSGLDGRTIAASLGSVTPDEADGIAAGETGFAPTWTVVRLSGGLTGHAYTVSNQVTFSDGTIDLRSITLRAEAR
jgi:hypothetical protein